MTTFKAALSICGLTLQGAAEYLSEKLGRRITKDTIGDMSRGKTFVPDDIWIELSDLYARIEDAADFTRSQIEPFSMDIRARNQITADEGAQGLPDGSDSAAGAMALLLAIRDVEDD